MPIYAAVRNERMQKGGLRAAEKHARREDLIEQEGETDEARKKRLRKMQRIRPGVDRDAPPSFGWALGQDDHLDICAAHAAHVEATGAVPYGNCAEALHLLVMISPERVKAAGDPYSKENSFAAAMLREARAWADTDIGGCFAVRYDVDERSAGVVDVFCAPVREYRGKVRIMPNSALRALQEREEATKSYPALQDSWARHCQEHLDPNIQRGKPKSETGVKHISQDLIRAAHEKREAAAEEDRKRWLDIVDGAVRQCQRMYQMLPKFARERAAALWNKFDEQMKLRLPPLDAYAKKHPPTIDQEIEDRIKARIVAGIATSPVRVPEDAYRLGLDAGLNAASDTAAEWMVANAPPESAAQFDRDGVFFDGDSRVPKTLADAVAESAAAAEESTESPQPF